MTSVLKEFKAFLMRGNIVDLAVAVVIGAAFGRVVDSLVADLIMPIIGIFGGSPDFTGNTFSINGSRFGYGGFLTVLIAFIITAAAIFFVVVKPMNMMTARAASRTPLADPIMRACPECMSDVPIAAKRCMHCAQPLPAYVKPAATR